MWGRAWWAVLVTGLGVGQKVAEQGLQLAAIPNQPVIGLGGAANLRTFAAAGDHGADEAEHHVLRRQGGAEAEGEVLKKVHARA